MLKGIRVLDLTDERAHLAGKMLGDMGADVIKVEPPGGDALRARPPFLEGSTEYEGGLAWQALNTSKGSVVLDLDEASDRARFDELVQCSDVLLETATPGTPEAEALDPARLAALNPGLVTASITPYGGSGPRAAHRAHDLVVVAMGGNAAMTGSPERAPLRCSMPTSHYHVAPEAVVGVLFALWGRAADGRGAHVDVSMQETQLTTLITGPGQYARARKARKRSGERTGRTREIWRTRDGWLSFGLRGGRARAPGLRALVTLMQERGMAPPWLAAYDWLQFNQNDISDDEIARLEQTIGAFFEAHTMAELYDEAVERKILLAPCNDAAAILAQPQLRHRGLFARIESDEAHGPEHPIAWAHTKDGAMRVRRRAPRLDEHARELEHTPVPTERAGTRTARTGRLFEGLKILELGSGAAGPVATRYFAEHGATVIRIESRARPDFLRTMYLRADHGDDASALERSPMFALLNPGKKSVSIRMDRPEGVALVRRLAGWADVVSENFTPGVMHRWGLGWQALHELKPELIMASSCLYGQTGPQRSYPGFGGQGAAISGFNHLTGWPGEAAHGPYATITDSLGPRFVAAAIAGALLERKRTGRGRRIDIAQIETAVYCLAEMIVRHSATGTSTERMGNRSEHAAPHGIYPTAGDDRWIAIAVLSDGEWQRLVRLMGEPAWATAPALASLAGRLRAQSELDEHLASWTRTQPAEPLMQQLQAAGVEAGVAQTYADLLDDPQLAHRAHFQTLEHPVLGPLAHERSGFRISGVDAGFQSTGPLLGQHNDEVLRDILGLSDAERAALVEGGVIQ